MPLAWCHTVEGRARSSCRAPAQGMAHLGLQRVFKRKWHLSLVMKNVETFPQTPVP